MAITGGLVMAQSPDAEQDQTKQTKAVRLAEILGGDVTEESVQAVFTQIKGEKRDAAVETRLLRACPGVMLQQSRPPLRDRLLLP